MIAVTNRRLTIFQLLINLKKMYLYKQPKPTARCNIFAAVAAVSAIAIVVQSTHAQTVGAPGKPATTNAAKQADLPPATPGWYGVSGERIVAPPPRSMTQQELALVERATLRRQLIAKGDYKAAYEFFSPSSRSVKSLDAFESDGAASSLRDVRATRAECDKDGRCSVTLVAQGVIKQSRVGDLGVPISLQEVWIAQPSGEAQLIVR